MPTENWTGHWHGYGPWTGTLKTYYHEGSRRPPHAAGPPNIADPKKQEDVLLRYHQAADDFLTSTVPPMMTGHWMLKEGRASADRTWTSPSAALSWLTGIHAENPPAEKNGGRAYIGIDEKVAYAATALPRGTDVSWVYYLPSRSLFSYSVVCCPNHFHPEIPCPQPPA